MPRISKLPAHLNNAPEEFIRQYLLDLDAKKRQEKMTSEYRRELHKKREEAKIQKNRMKTLYVNGPKSHKWANS